MDEHAANSASIRRRASSFWVCKAAARAFARERCRRMEAAAGEVRYGRVYDKFIGETEKRIQKVFRVARLAPCVLWIDELEKSSPEAARFRLRRRRRFVASAGVVSLLDAGAQAAVFVAATCNNVTVLPPELIRKGRFDELFFVDLPSAAERRQVFAIQLAKRKRSPGDYDLDRVAEAARAFLGGD